MSVLRKHALSLLCTGIVASTLVLAGCGGDDSEEASAAAAPSGGNRAPTITGTPLSSVMAGTSYTFTPNASDADGNTLVFTAANLPAWATFNETTGRLSGTPSTAHVGTYSNITISVSDGAAVANLPAFSIQIVATASGSALLTWTPPTQNNDGTALSDLAGYRLYWGTSQGNYTNSVNIGAGLSSYVVDQLTPARWYFVLTSVNSSGAESGYSNVASKQVM